MRIVREPFVRTNATHNARRESATTKNVVHYDDGKIIRVIAFNAGQDYRHAALINVFVHDISSRTRRPGIGRNGWHLLSVEWPISEQGLQFSNHGIPVEIPAHGHNEIRREETAFVERFNISARNRIEGGSSGIAVGPKFLAECQEIVLTLFN